jgi:hypothetical protein
MLPVFALSGLHSSMIAPVVHFLLTLIISHFHLPGKQASDALNVDLPA